MTEETPPDHAALVARLAESRAALLEALTERTEQDFARPLDSESEGETLGHALAVLASAERADIAIARAEEPPHRELPEKPLPPQVTHDLAGARHQTLSHLGTFDAATATGLVEAIVGRESALVARIGTMLDTPAERTNRAASPRIEFPVIE